MTKKFNKLINFYLNESTDKWAKTVNKEPGKMHKTLGIDPKIKIIDVYSDGKKLARDLLDKLKDKKEVTGMLAFAANIDRRNNVFDKALKSLKDL